MRRGVNRVVFALAVAGTWPPVVFAQTPLPLPTEPGGARPPVYTQPTTPALPVQPRPAPAPPLPAPPVTTAPAAATPAAGEGGAGEEEGKPKQLAIPLTTSFPELTQGVGNSDTLLQE